MLLFVASDRISAFDVVMAETIPDKGRVLTAMTTYWLEDLAGVAPSHLVTADPAQLPTDAQGMTDLAGRAMLVRRAEMLPLECIVRGYLAGSGWKEYASSGTLHGSSLPPGLQESDRLPEPLFTPSTKATAGHDENISFEAACVLVGREAAEAARDISLAVYRQGAAKAEEQGILIADTKLELGYIDGRLAICDEVLTPDSSRFWPADEWKPGISPPSFDKQPVRDWLEAQGWDMKPPPPALPPEVVKATSERYITACERITGRPFSRWYGVGT